MKSSPRTLKSISKSSLALCLLMLFGILCTSSFVSAADTKKAPNIVTVNGKAMEQAELDKQLNRIINSAKGQIPPEQIDKIKTSMQAQIIEHFITKTLLSTECNKLKLKVTDKELEDKLSEYKKRLPQGMTLEAALKQGGVDMKEMNDNIRFSLQVEKLIEVKTKDQPAPSEETIKEYFETNKKQFNTAGQVHARHILIKTDAKDDDKIKNEKKAGFFCLIDPDKQEPEESAKLAEKCQHNGVDVILVGGSLMVKDNFKRNCEGPLKKQVTMPVLVSWYIQFSFPLMPMRSSSSA